MRNVSYLEELNQEWAPTDVSVTMTPSQFSANIDQLLDSIAENPLGSSDTKIIGENGQEAVLNYDATTGGFTLYDPDTGVYRHGDTKEYIMNMLDDFGSVTLESTATLGNLGRYSIEEQVIQAAFAHMQEVAEATYGDTESFSYNYDSFWQYSEAVENVYAQHYEEMQFYIMNDIVSAMEEGNLDALNNPDALNEIINTVLNGYFGPEVFYIVMAGYSWLYTHDWVYFYWCLIYNAKRLC